MTFLPAFVPFVQRLLRRGHEDHEAKRKGTKDKAAQEQGSVPVFAGGQERIIVPTAYRADYLGALKALSHNAHTAPLIRMLDHAQQYTHAIDWSELGRARAMLERTGAFAEGDDARLRIPKGATD